MFSLCHIMSQHLFISMSGWQFPLEMVNPRHCKVFLVYTSTEQTYHTTPVAKLGRCWNHICFVFTSKIWEDSIHLIWRAHSNHVYIYINVLFIFLYECIYIHNMYILIYIYIHISFDATIWLKLVETWNSMYFSFHPIQLQGTSRWVRCENPGGYPDFDNSKKGNIHGQKFPTLSLPGHQSTLDCISQLQN